MKSLIFCLSVFGSVLCFGQTGCNNNPQVFIPSQIDLVEIKIKGNNGGMEYPFTLEVYESGLRNLQIGLFGPMSESWLFNKYIIRDMSYNLKKEETITPSFTYDINITALDPGEYEITVITADNDEVTAYFYKE